MKNFRFPLPWLPCYLATLHDLALRSGPSRRLIILGQPEWQWIIMVMPWKLHYIVAYMALLCTQFMRHFRWVYAFGWGATQSCMRFMAILESFLSSLHLLINGTGKVGYATLRGALANEKGVCQSNFYLTDFSGWGCNFRGNAKWKMLSPFQESSALLTAFFFRPYPLANWLFAPKLVSCLYAFTLLLSWMH